MSYSLTWSDRSTVASISQQATLKVMQKWMFHCHNVYVWCLYTLFVMLLLLNKYKISMVINYSYNWIQALHLGLSLLCQHNIEHYRVAKVLSNASILGNCKNATINNKISIKYIFCTVLWNLGERAIRILSNMY